MLHTQRPLLPIVALAGLLAVPTGFGAQAPAFMPVSEVRPGMVGISRTVFSGTTLEEFRAHIIGVLHNVIAPGRDLIVARLEGGPLARTGVIAGMSGSPVYVDGRLIGAVSYALGSFSREPIAGITPIQEMVDAMRGDVTAQTRQARSEFSLEWPATPTQVYAALGRLVNRAANPVRSPLRPDDIVGEPSLADWAPQLRPIGAAMTARGLTGDVEAGLQAAFGGRLAQAPAQQPGATTAGGATLRPGDAVGMTFLRGDLEMGATGTVTHVDGRQVYAFGHAFLSQGPTSMPMTRASVLTILPSLDSSMKIGEMGPVVGRMTQDRSVGVSGVLGPGPEELAVRVTLQTPRGAGRTFTFQVVQDQAYTPLFAFVSVLNVLASYERPAGPTTINATGTIDFGSMGTLSIDDVFTGDVALTEAANVPLAAIGTMATNPVRSVLPRSMDLTIALDEREDHLSIERIWLDTTRPTLGGTHTLHVQLRRYRGTLDTVSMPVTMPAQASGPLTLLVSDATALRSLEQTALRPAPPTTIDAVWSRLQDTRANHTLYVRLLDDAGGVAVAGQSQAALPASVQAATPVDSASGDAALLRAVVGQWQRRLSTVVRGSRELQLTLRPATRVPSS